MKTKQQIQKNIASIARRGANYEKFVQTTAVDVVEHYRTHRDWTLAIQLLGAMTKLGRSKLKKYLEFALHGEFIKDSDGELRFARDEGKAPSLEMVRAVRWTDYKAEAAQRELDLGESALRLAKRAIKALKLEGESEAAAIAAFAEAARVVEGLATTPADDGDKVADIKAA